MARAVQHDALGLVALDGVRKEARELAGADAAPREIEDGHQPRVHGLPERQRERARAREDLGRPFLERDEVAPLLPLRAFEEELHPEGGLSGARAARHQRDAAREEAPAEELVEAEDAGREALRALGRRRRAVRHLCVVPGEHLDPVVGDREVMAAQEVARVPELVDLDVAPTLGSLLHRAEQDDAVHDRLLDAEAADLGGAVRDVGGEEAHGLRVLDDRRELEHLLARDLRILDAVEEHRDGVDGDAASLQGLDALLHHEQVHLHEDVRLRDELDLDHPAVDLALQVPAHPDRRREEAVPRLLEREHDALLARQRAPVDELEEQERLARPRDARHEQARAARDARAEERVELGDPDVQAMRLALFRLRGPL